MNLPFVIVHFNTPQLTTCLCSSIRKYHPDNEIIIFDNSTVAKFPEVSINLFNITYLDNTQNQFIDFDKVLEPYNKSEKIVKQNNLGSARHCITIDFLIKYLDRNFILLDSDILFRKPVDFIDESFITMGMLSTEEQKLKRIRQLRIYPFLQYLNVKKIKENNIMYFNPSEMVGIDGKDDMIFDTGASFYKQVVALGNKAYNDRINIFNYIVHLNAGSWSDRSHEAWLMKYKDLWK